MSEAEFDSYLSLLSKFLRLRSRQRADLADELRDHLEARLEELTAAGKTREQAVVIALEEFGDAALLASEFSRLASRRTRKFVMRCTAASAAVVAAVLLLSVALAPPRFEGPGPEQATAQQGPAAGEPSGGVPAIPDKTSIEQQAIAALDEKLAKPIKAEYENVALRDVIQSIADGIEADALIAEKTLEDSGVSLDDPVTLKLTRTPLSARTVLEFVLEPRDLALVNRSGVLYVTTVEVADELLVLKVYNVRDLLADVPQDTFEEWVPITPGGGGGGGGGGFFSTPDIAASASLLGGVGQVGGSDEREVDPSELPPAAGEAPQNANSDVRKYKYRRHALGAGSLLLNTIQTTTSGPWFGIDGVGGTIAPFNGLLVVRQTEQIHGEIQKLLEALREAGRQQPGGTGTLQKENRGPAGGSLVPRESDAAVVPAGDPVEKSPLRSAVRLRVKDERGEDFGSGTVVGAHDGKTIVLTCWHVFRDSKDGETFEADLFPEGPSGQPKTVNGRVFTFNSEADLALVELDASLDVPVASIAEVGQAVEPGDRVYSVGCSEGRPPAKSHHIVMRINPYKGPATIECTGMPPVGRSGAGLFGNDERLIGVCFAAVRENRTGVYVGVEEIRELLESSRLSDLSPSTPTHPTVLTTP